MVSLTYAQESPDQIARKYGVTFPIKELGNCANYSECRTYCDDPVNSTGCIDFAKKKGFYKEPELNVQKDKVLSAAKAQLGCDSEQSCMTLCEQPGNYDRCSSFAKSQGLEVSQNSDPKNSQVLQKAKTILGCDSQQSCQTLCEDSANRTKCDEFAKQTGLRGGEQRVGPGGCTSEESCGAFCSAPENFQICSGYASTAGANFRGPGGCSSEESCRDYCEKNPGACRNFGGNTTTGPGPGFNPQEMCNRTPNCSWSGNSCQCSGGPPRGNDEEYRRYCESNPDRCRGTENLEQQRQQSGNNMSREQQETTCRSGGGSCDWSSGICNCRGYRSGNGATSGTGGSYSGGGTSSYSGPTSSREQQEATCKSGGGTCSWVNNVCNCQGYHSSGTTGGGSTNTVNTAPAPTSAPSGMTRESQEAGCRSCGGTCNWNGDFCSCQCASSGSSGSTSQSSSAPAPAPTSNPEPQPQQEQQSAPDPATACAQTSGCSWNGSSCQCGSTQGVYTSRGLLQQLLSVLGF